MCNCNNRKRTKIIKLNPNKDLIFPSKAKDVVLDFLKSKDKNTLEINPEDYFILKYSQVLYKKLSKDKRDFVLLYKEKDITTKDLYELPAFNKLLNIFRELYLLDFDT